MSHRRNDRLEFRLEPPDPQFLGVPDNELETIICNQPGTGLADDARQELRRRLIVRANLQRKP